MGNKITIVLCILLMAGFFLLWFWVIGNYGFEGNGDMGLLKILKELTSHA